jgi:hypothetical protein
MLDKLNGTRRSRVALRTGLSPERLDELGGVGDVTDDEIEEAVDVDEVSRKRGYGFPTDWDCEHRKGVTSGRCRSCGVLIYPMYDFRSR